MFPAGISEVSKRVESSWKHKRGTLVAQNETETGGREREGAKSSRNCREKERARSTNAEKEDWGIELGSSS